ncbi:hypothetical protein GCM10023320_49780 [Pseudonocardia adelaidensis]|uniref:Uncharacterized protein n=1 Tax=Pseudonocardia adelaidensis TaxID=648754 RepID=A0ABP9NQA0_9PSEU
MSVQPGSPTRWAIPSRLSHSSLRAGWTFHAPPVLSGASNRVFAGSEASSLAGSSRSGFAFRRAARTAAGVAPRPFANRATVSSGQVRISRPVPTELRGDRSWVDAREPAPSAEVTFWVVEEVTSACPVTATDAVATAGAPSPITAVAATATAESRRLGHLATDHLPIRRARAASRAIAPASSRRVARRAACSLCHSPVCRIPARWESCSWARRGPRD